MQVYVSKAFAVMLVKWRSPFPGTRARTHPALLFRAWLHASAWATWRGKFREGVSIVTIVLNFWPQGSDTQLNSRRIEMNYKFTIIE